LKSFVINKNDAGQRLDKFVAKSLPALPPALMYRYIRLKRIKVNGKRTEISHKLTAGDFVEMYINDEFFVQPAARYDFLTASKNLDIIYEDQNIMLLNKSVGLLAHPDESEYIDTLITRVKRYLFENGSYNPEDENSFAPALVNRIDRNTGGIVIAAKTADALRILNHKMKNRELRKFYLCVVQGTLPKESGLLEGWLSKDEANNKVKVYNSKREGSKEIKTKYRVISAEKGLSLVEVELLTGRTHQIRAHFAYIGCPLLGDGKYGKKPAGSMPAYKKQFLYSYKLIFDSMTDAGDLDYLDGQVFEVKDVWFARNFPHAIFEG
jgi:23S rRNA pseudouridine955/2504/2580 synthase